MRLKYFTEKENWGEMEMMDGHLLLALDAVREHVQSPFIIHAGYAVSGHAPKSFHYRGQAVDFHIKGLSFYDAYNKVLQAIADLQLSNFCGFGVYFDWQNKGFHLDNRGYMARWGRDQGVYIEWKKAVEKISRT